MSGFGQFSQEAYDQLREAYSNQLSQAEDVETAGVKIGSDTLGLETAPFKADWLDKTGLWKYPDGKGDYMDTKQSQEDLLAALRSQDGDETEEDIDLSDLSDEELLALAAQMVEEEGGDEESEEKEEEIGDLTDEELDALLDEILAASEDDEESEDEEESDDEEEEGDEEEGDDAISVAEKIAALKEELASLSASLTLEGDEEEAEAEDEEEEPTEAVEETDSEEDPIKEEEEVNSDDEP